MKGEFMYLELKEISKNYDEKIVVDNLNLGVEKGKILCLVGASGCGKTTILNMIGGFVKPDKGYIILNKNDITFTPIEKRHISTVFQSYCLFQNMNVFDNIAYGLKIAKVPKAEIYDRVEEFLKIVELQDYKDKKVYNLSGGQQQRVAIARSLVVEPSLCLLDEPFCNLDVALRIKMREELKHLQATLRTTMVFVTHDHEEALYLADNIAVLHNGRLMGLYNIDDVKAKRVDDYSRRFLSLDDYEWNGDYLLKRMRLN